MVTKEMLDYITSQTKRGIPKETIRTMLLKSGWDMEDIGEAENIVYSIPAAPTIPTPEPAVIKTITPAQEPVRPITKIEPSSLLNALENYKQKSQSLAGSQMPFASQSTIQRPATEPVRTPIIPTQPAIQPTAQPSTQPLQAHEILGTHPMEAKVAPMEIRPQPKIRHRRSLLIPLIIFLLILSGGVAYGYYAGYFVPADKVGVNTFAAITNAKSANFDTTTSIAYSGNSTTNPLYTLGIEDTSNLSISATGSYDKNDAQNPKVSSTITINAGSNTIGLDLRGVADNLYLKATSLPATTSSFDFSVFKDQWVVIPGMSNAGYMYLPSSLTAGLESSIANNLTDEQKAHIAEMTANAHFVKVTKRFIPEMVQGVLTYHVAFDIDQAGISAYLFDLETYIHDIANDRPEFASFSTSTTKKSLAKMTNFNGEAWIGHSNNLPYKVTLTFTSQENETDTATVTMSSTFSNWNQPMTIDAPTNVLPFEDIFQESTRVPREKALDAATIATVSSLRVDAEMYHQKNTSYKNFCKSEAVDVDITCKDSTAAYIAYKMLTNTPTFACADSKGFAGNIPTEPKGFVCQ